MEFVEEVKNCVNVRKHYIFINIGFRISNKLQIRC